MRNVSIPGLVSSKHATVAVAATRPVKPVSFRPCLPGAVAAGRWPPLSDI